MSLISVLIAVQSPLKRDMFYHFLSPAKFETAVADSPEQVFALLREQPFQIVLADLPFWGERFSKSLQVLNTHFSATHILLMASESERVERNRQISLFPAESFDMPALAAQICALAQAYSGLNYQFSRLNLFDLNQLVSLSPRERHLYLAEPDTAREGLLFFEQGQIRHAVFDQLHGEEAFYAVMGMKSGFFSETDLAKPEYYSIQMPMNHLMANSALHLDQEKTAVENLLQPVKFIICEPSSQLCTPLLKRFASTQPQIISCALKDLEKTFQVQSPDLLFLHTDLLEDKPFQFFRWLRLVYKGPVILFGTILSSEMFACLRLPQIVGFFSLPEQQQALETWVYHQFFDQRFSGELKDLLLLDVLQVLGGSRQSCRITVHDYFRHEKGEIFMQHGELIHACFAEHEGKAALREQCRIIQGVFKFDSFQEPEKQTLEGSLGRLILQLQPFLEAPVLSA
ncbi:MAG: DUF4388 domain-containing protein [Candidatus Sericytochromatia bacterium]